MTYNLNNVQVSLLERIQTSFINSFYFSLLKKNKESLNNDERSLIIRLNNNLFFSEKIFPTVSKNLQNSFFLSRQSDRA